jgi:hypothetical protein
MRERNLVDEWRTLHHVRRRIDVRRIMHAGGNALRQDAGLGVVMDALDLDVFEIGPVRGLVAETMGQIVELEAHAVGQVLLERHAANFFCHGTSSPLPARRHLSSSSKIEPCVLMRFNENTVAKAAGRNNGQEDCG